MPFTTVAVLLLKLDHMKIFHEVLLSSTSVECTPLCTRAVVSPQADLVAVRSRARRLSRRFSTTIPIPQIFHFRRSIGHISPVYENSFTNRQTNTGSEGLHDQILKERGCVSDITSQSC